MKWDRYDLTVDEVSTLARHFARWTDDVTETSHVRVAVSADGLHLQPAGASHADNALWSGAFGRPVEEWTLTALVEGHAFTGTHHQVLALATFLDQCKPPIAYDIDGPPLGQGE